MATAIPDVQGFLNAIFLSMSAEQINGVIANFQNRTDDVQQPAENVANVAAPAVATNTEPVVRANPAVRTSVLRGRRAREGRRRPLNSFIAFRSK